tara:strand:+ start:120 stop:473 length:354 start_codon:yes stop_codon:yes gene_type:complete
MPNKDKKGDNTEIQYDPNRNDNDWQNAVTEHTKLGYSMFRIHKANGEVREMVCTLKTDIIPETKTNTEKSVKGNLTVYDVEAEGWRTVKFDRVIFWKMLADYPEPDKASSFVESSSG